MGLLAESIAMCRQRGVICVVGCFRYREEVVCAGCAVSTVQFAFLGNMSFMLFAGLSAARRGLVVSSGTKEPHPGSTVTTAVTLWCGRFT